jgi:hypothetical protein
MDANARDERMRRLQRLAYGAVASDADRASALTELEQLRREMAVERADAASEPDAHLDSPLMPAPTGPAATSPIALVESSAEAGAFARRFRWAIAIGTAALLAGVAVGWQLSARMAPLSTATAALSAVDSPSPEPRTMAEFLAARPIAAETQAAEVFLRPATGDDIPVTGSIDDFGNGPLEFRLLATRPDGIRLYAARDSVDLCLYVSFGEYGSSAACTTEGRFPEDGLTVTGSVYRAPDSVDATWHTDGSLQLRGLIG